MNYNRNKLNAKMFSLGEQVSDVFRKNIKLQKKLDDINIKGSGNYCQTKVKLPPKIDKGSLNYQEKKKEALRIDYENILMAQRLVSAKPAFPVKCLEK